MIKQLGPSTFFVTFTTRVNNWPILLKTLKDLHVQHARNFTIENENSPNIKDFAKNDLVTCAPYYEHKMNSFQKIL